MALGALRPRRRTEHGAAAVEFALVMLPLLYLVFGIIQYGMLFYSMQAGSSAVADGVRRLTVGDCTNNSDLKTLLKNRLGSATTSTASGLSPTVAYSNSDGSTTAKIGGTVTLTLTYPTLDLNFPFIPAPTIVTRSVSARVEDTSPSGAACS